MLDQQVSERRTVDQNNLVLNFSHIFLGRFRETASGDKNSFARLLSMQCTDERLNFFAPYLSVIPAFGLQIDSVKPKLVFFDHGIDAAVAGLSDCLSEVSP